MTSESERWRIVARANIGVRPEDLVEAGNLGLLAAADRFDPGRNVHFATYARFWIKLEIHNALSNTARTIRIPIYLVHLIRRWRRSASLLQEQFVPQLLPLVFLVECGGRIDRRKRKVVELALHTETRRDAAE